MLSPVPILSMHHEIFQQQKARYTLNHCHRHQQKLSRAFTLGSHHCPSDALRSVHHYRPSIYKPNVPYLLLNAYLAPFTASHHTEQMTASGRAFKTPCCNLLQYCQLCEEPITGRAVIVQHTGQLSLITWKEKPTPTLIMAIIPKRAVGLYVPAI